MEVGRVDLVEEIRDRDDEYRRQKAEMVKGKYFLILILS